MGRIDCINLIPKFIMKFLVILSLAAMAMARPQEQPASFACPNYPFCAIAANAPAPQQYQPHQDLYLAQRQALNQPLVADVPGIAQWYADLHAQQAAQGLKVVIRDFITGIIRKKPSNHENQMLTKCI